MLNQKFTRTQLTRHEAVETGAAIQEEGLALVFVKEGLETKVNTSTGANGEIFAGFSLSRNSPPTMVPFYGEAIVPADGKLQLPRMPLANQLLVKVAGTKGEEVADPANVAAGKYLIDGDVAVFHADDAGKAVVFQMMYEPTISEARTLLGDAPIGGVSSAYQDQIGLITIGEVETSCFDASVDWSEVFHPRLGANGLLTVGGAGTELKNVVVKRAPNSESAFLQLAVTVG